MPENDRHAATLPNLGMWMNGLDRPSWWKTALGLGCGIHVPVENGPAYPPFIPGRPSVRTPRCPHYAHLIPNRWKVIHNSACKSGIQVYVHSERPSVAPPLGKTGG
jgi:hypothetical protein